MIDIKKLTQQKNELNEIWEYLGIEVPFPDKDVRLWLLDFSKDEVESAFKELAKREQKVVAPVKYVGKILHNSKLNNMTVEQRAERVSAMRAMVGAVGGRKKHETEVAAVKREFSEICNDSPPVCRTFGRDLAGFASGIGFGSGIGSGLDSGSDTGTGTGSDPAEPKGCGSLRSPVAPPQAEEKRKATPKPKPETKTTTENPFASGLKPIRRCKTCNGILRRSVNHVCPPPPTCFDCGIAEFNHDCKGDADEANQTPKPETEDRHRPNLAT
jgi:hypothetical protein